MYWLSLQTRVFLQTYKRLHTLSVHQKYIFYLGIPVHTNLGDLAQGICIREWLSKHYPFYKIIEIETTAITRSLSGQALNKTGWVLKLLSKKMKDQDFIVFQSGYTTTDLGGDADKMHQMVIDALPNVRMLMFPQTIFFKYKKNQIRTSRILNKAMHMLFLARDPISYQSALEMFPNLSVELYPDIATVLIGKTYYTFLRDSILFCIRDDTERFYSDAEINELIEKCRGLGKIIRTDTTKKGRRSQIVRNAPKYINREIENYAKSKVVITDRYHGTIFSLAAGTPVIVLKTTDHKVITGIDWFKDVYSGYVYLAENLDDAFILVNRISSQKFEYKLHPFFEQKYYDRLPHVFQNI